MGVYTCIMDKVDNKTEGGIKIDQILSVAGISLERWGLLSPQTREIVSLGLVNLENINRGGSNIENSDQSVLGTIDEFRKIVELNSDEISSRYHGSSDWFLQSANLMMLAVRRNGCGKTKQA